MYEKFKLEPAEAEEMRK